MLLWPVAAESVAGDLELLRSVAEAHEAEDPEQDADSLSRDHLDGADIDGLRVVAQPVAKVNTLHVHLAELLAGPAADEQGEQCVLNVSMAPVLPLDSAQARDVASTKRRRGTSPEDEQDEAWQPDVAELEIRRHREFGCLYSAVSLCIVEEIGDMGL